MQLRKYPSRFHLRKVIEQFMNNRDSKSFFQEQGILIQSTTRKEISRIGSDHYFSRRKFIELKEKIEVEHNYKKTGRIELPSEQVHNFKEALLEIQGSLLSNNDDEETKVTVTDIEDGKWLFTIDYVEYKPSMIDLLDRTARRIEVNINNINDSYSLDFDILTSRDYAKVKQVLDYLHRNNDEMQFDFSEISLKLLNCNKRIQLFNDFFQHDHHPWEFKEIKKLKVKRDDEEEVKNIDTLISSEQLQGINSAIIDGKNLIENNFVKHTLGNGFYFSMAAMRFENINDSSFIEVAIEFKTRPEKCELNMLSSGYLIEQYGEPIEESTVFDAKIQAVILFEFKNALHQIFKRLLREKRVLFSAGKANVSFIGDSINS